MTQAQTLDYNDPRVLQDIMNYKAFKIKVKELVTEANYISPDEDIPNLNSLQGNEELSKLTTKYRQSVL